jgi:hypothetical protein
VFNDSLLTTAQLCRERHARENKWLGAVSRRDKIWIDGASGLGSRAVFGRRLGKRGSFEKRLPQRNGRLHFRERFGSYWFLLARRKCFMAKKTWFIGLLVLAGCGVVAPGFTASNGTGGTGGTGSTAGTGGTTGTVCADGYATYAQAALQTYCESCHQHTGEFTLAAVQAKRTTMASRIADGSMPPANDLPAADKSRLEAWLNCGAPDQATGGTSGGTGSTGGTIGGTSGSTGTVDPSQCTDGFDSFAKPAMQTYCEVCHNHGGEFSALPAVQANLSVIRGRIADGLMPPDNSMPADVTQRLITWIDCGAPQVGLVDAGPQPVFDAGPPVLCQPTGIYDNPYGDWQGDGYVDMLPGDNCMACHSANGQGPSFYAAGTVYDPTGTVGVSGVVVTISDDLNNTRTATTQPSGNFEIGHSRTKPALTPPLHISLSKGGTVVPMQHPAVTGACNVCHNGAATQCNAPSRVHFP